MNRQSLICHLCSGAPEKTAKTIAPLLNMKPAELKSLIDEINDEEEYIISTGKGGGLTITKNICDEKKSYPYIAHHVQTWIAKSIYRNYGSTKYHFKETHKIKLSGKWSTPDFTTVCAHKFSYAAPSTIEVVSFEVKHTETQFDVTAVYEALAHTRASNYSVLFYYDPPHNSYIDRNLDDVFDEIKFCCASLGVGLIVSNHPSEINSWQYYVMAERHTPDLRKVDYFLEETFKTHADRKWFKDET